jgi:hypothetical protein
VSALNWNAGDIATNTTVIRAGGRSGTGPGGAINDFAVAYNGPSGTAHFVADVVGYLVENQTTALNCFETAVQSQSLAQSQSGTILSMTCPVGWTVTSGNCDSERENMWIAAKGISSGRWYCTYYSSFNGLPQIYASSICCRIPGH